MKTPHIEQQVGLSDDLRERVQSHFSRFSESLSDDLRNRFFDETIREYCLDMAAALDGEIAVWVFEGSATEGRFRLLLGGPRLHLRETPENGRLFDQVFHRRMVSQLRLPHSERCIEPTREQALEMIRELDVSVTSIMSARFGQSGALEGVVSVFRFEDEGSLSPFRDKSFEDADPARFRFYLEILNRLLDHAYLKAALER